MFDLLERYFFILVKNEGENNIFIKDNEQISSTVQKRSIKGRTGWQLLKEN
jgi:hypothetical protein